MWHLVSPLYLSEWSDDKRKYLFESCHDRDEAMLDSCVTEFGVSVQPIYADFWETKLWRMLYSYVPAVSTAVFVNCSISD